MSETSRDYWRNPRVYASNERELKVSLPEHYTSAHMHRFSNLIGGAILSSGADKEWSVLEVGCNCGRNLKHLHESGFTNLAGVEINPEAKEIAWEFAPEIAPAITISDAQTYLAMCAPDSFDLIFTQSVLMHVPPEDDYLIKQISRVAKRMIATCEVERNERTLLSRHKYDRGYKALFTEMGWKETFFQPDARRSIRVFVR